MTATTTRVSRAWLARLTAGLFGLLLLAAPTSARAQLPWESPQLLRPGAPAGWSVMFIDYGLDPNSGLGGALAYRTEPAPRGLGWRASVAQGLGDKLNFAGGVDISAPLLRAANGFPLDLIWTGGAGGSYGEYIQIALPVGVAGGRSLSAEHVWFNPYTSARAVLEGRLGDAAPEGDVVSFGLAIDVGADLALGRSRSFLMRFAVSLGDRNAAAVGFHLGSGSGLSPTRVSPIRRVP
ncbi:MAG: hypothetical protein ACRENP_15595 [Longimicrobiales bacterium]